jgi:hypothetical protein
MAHGRTKRKTPAVPLSVGHDTGPNAQVAPRNVYEERASFKGTRAFRLVDSHGNLVLRIEMRADVLKYISPRTLTWVLDQIDPVTGMTLVDRGRVSD